MADILKFKMTATTKSSSVVGTVHIEFPDPENMGLAIRIMFLRVSENET